MEPKKFSCLEIITSSLIMVLLGVSVGWILSISKNEPTIIGTLLPVLLTSGVGIVLYGSKYSHLASITINVFLLIFIISIVSSTIIFVNKKNENASQDVIQTIFLTKDYLSLCSKTEEIINKERKYMSLPPLDSEYFCKF